MSLHGEVSIQWNNKVRQGLNDIPPYLLYSVARRVLDETEPIIPMKSGKMRTSSMSAGVRGSGNDFYIGSYTGYASSVWKMTNVNWTTPGTNNQWFLRVYKQHGQRIVDQAFKEAWRKSM